LRCPNAHRENRRCAGVQSHQALRSGAGIEEMAGIADAQSVEVATLRKRTRLASALDEFLSFSESETTSFLSSPRLPAIAAVARNARKCGQHSSRPMARPSVRPLATATALLVIIACALLIDSKPTGSSSFSGLAFVRFPKVLFIGNVRNGLEDADVGLPLPLAALFRLDEHSMSFCEGGEVSEGVGGQIQEELLRLR
ncbi:hypothetical protein HPB47_003657, partial [Ixodes persulcatus]